MYVQNVSICLCGWRVSREELVTLIYTVNVAFKPVYTYHTLVLCTALLKYYVFSKSGNNFSSSKVNNIIKERSSLSDGILPMCWYNICTFINGRLLSH